MWRRLDRPPRLAQTCAERMGGEPVKLSPSRITEGLAVTTPRAELSSDLTNVRGVGRHQSPHLAVV